MQQAITLGLWIALLATAAANGRRQSSKANGSLFEGAGVNGETTNSFFKKGDLK